MSFVAVCQFAPGSDTADNLAIIQSDARSAAERGATLAVFPEYSSYFRDPLGPASVAAAEPLDGPFVAALAAVAISTGVHLVAGMLETMDATHFSNTLVAVSPAGVVEATYRKLHLYDAFGQRESDFVRAGDIAPPQTFGWEGFTVGMQTCYDIRFPEVSRRLVDAGADLILVPAEWVRGSLKEQHWRTLLTARAIENTIYIAAADHAPPVGVGNSMVIDPMGVELVTIGDGAGVAVAEVALDRVESVRRLNPALQLRRFGTHPL